MIAIVIAVVIVVVIDIAIVVFIVSNGEKEGRSYFKCLIVRIVRVMAVVGGQTPERE